MLESCRDVGALRFQYVGLKQADLTKFGGERVHPVRWLTRPENLPDGSVVFVAGGEVLAAYWSGLHAFLLPTAHGWQIYSGLRRFFREETLDGLSRRWFRVPWHIPFVPAPSDFRNEVITCFNAVGGAGLAQRSEQWREEVRNRLASARYVSVRDRATRDELRGLAGVQLAPDIAMLLGDLYSRNDTLAPCRKEVRDAIMSADYLCFQVNNYCSQKAIEKFARQLDKVESTLGLRIILLPIGRASGHADHVPLKVIAEKMSRPAYSPPLNLTVAEVLAFLANARCYAGTSLHGIITAMSYGVPHIAIRKIPKVSAFLDTWAIPEMREVPAQNDLAAAVASRVGEFESDLATKGAELRVLARERFEQLAAAI